MTVSMIRHFLWRWQNLDHLFPIENKESSQLLLSLSAFLPHTPSLLAERDQLGSFGERYGGQHLKYMLVII